MASKPEKRVASSVFITLAPPRRDVAVTEEVSQAASQAVCEARRARPWETLPTKTPGAAVGRSPKTWMPSGRSNASLPEAQPQLSNGGCSPPPPSLNDEDLDLLLPPPPPPSAYLPLPEEEPPVLPGTSLISDLEQLHLPPPPLPPPLQAPQRDLLSSLQRDRLSSLRLVTSNPRKRSFLLLQKSLSLFQREKRPQMSVVSVTSLCPLESWLWRP